MNKHRRTLNRRMAPFDSPTVKTEARGARRVNSYGTNGCRNEGKKDVCRWPAPSGPILFVRFCFLFILFSFQCLPTYILSPNPSHAIRDSLHHLADLSQLHLQVPHIPATLNCTHLHAPSTDSESAVYLVSPRKFSFISMTSSGPSGLTSGDTDPWKLARISSSEKC